MWKQKRHKKRKLNLEMWINKESQLRSLLCSFVTISANQLFRPNLNYFWCSDKINHIVLSHYFGAKPRGIFRDLSNMKDGALCEDSERLSGVNFSWKTPRLKCLAGSWTRLWNLFVVLLREELKLKILFLYLLSKRMLLPKMWTISWNFLLEANRLIAKKLRFLF